MMLVANILPGQWKQHEIYQYAVWVHRLSRALKQEIEKLPAQPPPLPWPVYQKPINELRNYHPSLFPKFPVKPKRRPHLNSYVPRTIDLDAARTEVYRPEKGDDFLWRIKMYWDRPQPWEIEAIVDPGGAVYLPFFRQVTIRLPLKAKICRTLEVGKDGRWRGECRRVMKLNARAQIKETTQWIVDSGQGIAVPDSNSRGAVAYRAKQAARELKANESRLDPRRRPLEGALYVKGFKPPNPWKVRYEPRVDFALQEQEREQVLQAELEVMQALQHTMYWQIKYSASPGFLYRDDHDGYLLTRTETGPDDYEYRKPEPHWRRTPWGRKIKRGPTARERLAKVKPSVRIVPHGPRTSELVITRRMHEVSIGLPEALNLARMIEGAIKYRNPVQSNRKRSWRQQFRDQVLYRPGLLSWLVRNPVDKGEGIGDSEKRNASQPSVATVHGLPNQYLELVNPRWWTSDGEPFAATPGGNFATSVEGFRLRLPIAVMPPEFYERWLARGGNKPRKRRRMRGSLRRRKRAGCTCCFERKNRPAFQNGRSVKSGFS